MPVSGYCPDIRAAASGPSRSLRTAAARLAEADTAPGAYSWRCRNPIDKTLQEQFQTETLPKIEGGLLRRYHNDMNIL